MEKTLKKLDIPAKIRDEYDGYGHPKLTAEQQELQDVIQGSSHEMRLEGFGTLSRFQVSWIRKDVEKYLESQGKGFGIVVDTISGDGEPVTDKEKSEFMVDKIIEELRKMRSFTGRKGLSVDWYDVERKCRLLLNEFGNKCIDAEDGVKTDPRPLVRLMALVLDGMFRFGKWSNSSEKAEVKRQK